MNSLSRGWRQALQVIVLLVAILACVSIYFAASR